MKTVHASLAGWISCAVLAGGAWKATWAGTPIVLAPEVPPAERLAAADLSAILGQLFPGETFPLAAALPEAGPCIALGSDPRTRALAKAVAPSAPESFAVTTANDGARVIGIIAGADPRGTARGVYALLEKLGCNFSLSGDALPRPQGKPFDFGGWAFADRPLVRERIVFDWHNFLSGCSTWNLEDWNRWTTQSQKMGYNAVMVHAYGNNPMVSFEFNGKTKPVGYLSSTVKGRDWSTMHVNDVRRLFGGECFRSPVFGADAALVPDEQRAAAARELMRGVFAHAQERAMDVYFALDVDTGSANPQDLILTLPESARFPVQTKAGGLSGIHGEGNQAFWLANPDTPEGYTYYKAQLQALLTDYPQITTLVVWFRNGGTPWMDLKVTEMPADWRAQYQAAVAQKPEADKFWHAPNLFALGKITRAFERALRELGQDKVRLALGTWNFAFLPAADLFVQPGIPLIGLDYGVLHDDSKLATAENRLKLAAVGAHRPVIPVIWAHHDDGNYLGRSYTPFAEFQSKLAESQASGFGIIHWTTRPLDLYFTSHISQVWQQTANEPLGETCRSVARRSFGTDVPEAAEYLQTWVTQAPKFSRETSDHFIDKPLADIPGVIAGCQARLKLLERVDPASLPADARDRLLYFRGLESFLIAIFEAHGRFQDAQTALQKGDLAAARAAMQGCRPEPVIEQFAAFSSLGGITRGELGSIVSLNTRWLPHLVRLRQQLGMEAVRYRFGPTSHDPLAQAPGHFTFHFDAEHHLWETLGTEETGVPTFLATPGDAASVAGDLCRSGIESDQPIELSLSPILAKKKDSAAIPAGNYRLRLLLLDPSSTAPGQRVFAIGARIVPEPGIARVSFAPVQARFLRLECRGNSLNDWNSIEEIQIDSLAKDSVQPLALASSAVKDYPAEAAIDGNRKTRWAARGRSEWIQFRLDPQAQTRHLEIAWFGNDGRQPLFDIRVSNDGMEWKEPAQIRSPGSAPALTLAERVDIFAETGGSNRPLERAFPVSLPTPGRLMLTLTPLTGKALLCGATLEPATN